MTQDAVLDWFFSSDYSKKSRKASSLTFECRDENGAKIRLLFSYNLLIAIIGVPDTNTVLVNLNEGYSRTTDRHIWSVIRRTPESFTMIKFPFASGCDPFYGRSSVYDVTNLNFIGNPDYMRSYIRKHDLMNLRYKRDRDRDVYYMRNLYYDVLPFLKEKYAVNAAFYEQCMFKVGDYLIKAADPGFIKTIQAIARGKLTMSDHIKDYWKEL